MMLPSGATPEEQAEQGPAWICAVFLAGLFHHLDWLSQIEGSLANGKAWCPEMEISDANWRVRPRLGRTASMNGMFIASKLIPDAAAIWLQRWPTISGALFLYLSGQKAQSGILNSIISDALGSVAFKSGTVSGTASPSESDKVIISGEKGEEEFRTNNISNLIDDDMHQTSSHKNITPVPEPINNASIGYDTNQTDDYAAKDVTGQVTLLSAFDNHHTQSSDERTGDETVPDESASTAELLSVLD